MDIERARRLWLAIDVLEAQETLQAYQRVVYPKMKANAQRTELVRIKKTAYPRGVYSTGKSSITAKELAAKLGKG